MTDDAYDHPEQGNGSCNSHRMSKTGILLAYVRDSLNAWTEAWHAKLSQPLKLQLTPRLKLREAWAKG